MFNNIGQKIKTLAIIITIIGIVASLAIGIYLCVDKMVFIGLIIIFAGIIISWVGSFVLYGYGELLVNSKETAENTEKLLKLSVANIVEFEETEQNSQKKSDVPSSTPAIVDDSIEKKQAKSLKKEIVENVLNDEDENDEENLDAPKADECPNCFCKIAKDDKECPNCGYKLC